MQHLDTKNRKKNLLPRFYKMLLMQLVLAALFMAPVAAQNFTVNSNADTHATTPGTSAADNSGFITLRSAVEAATAQAGTHIITIPASITAISLSQGTMTLGSAANGNNITINGPGKAVLTVTQTTANRVFSTGTGAVTVAINDLTINYAGPAGVITGGGGAIIAGGANAVTSLTNVAINNFNIQQGNGGAILCSISNTQTMTLTGCDFNNNLCGGAGGAVAFVCGNGVGSCTITGCKFTGNSTGVVGSGTGGDGGAVSVTGSGNGGTYSITKCTFLNNQVQASSAHGGAIINTNGTLTATYNRFIGNTAPTATNGNSIAQAGGATVNITNSDNNWWGVNTPSANDNVVLAAGGTITINKWLQVKATSTSTQLCGSGTATITASFLSNSASEAIAAANLTALVGLPVTFTPILGSISGAQTTIQAAGTATATYTAGTTGGTGSVVTSVDNVPTTDGAPAKVSITISKPTVTNPGTTTGTINTAFSQTFTAAGGVAAYTFTLNSGSLPTGLTLSSAGVLSGTPTQSGTFPITVKVTDNATCTGTSATYTLVINCQTITVTNPGTTTGTIGTAFSQTFTQTNAAGGATFTLNSGSLPTGLTLSSAGVLSGTPTQSGTFPITVKVTDGNGCTGVGATYTLVINCQTITVTNPGTATGTAGTAFSQTFTQTGGSGAVTFSTTSTLPTGLTLSAGGVLSGTPTQTGTFPIVVKATDANGCSANGTTYTLVISCPTITVTNPAITTGQLNTAFSQTFTQTGGIGAVTFSTTSTLPAGITLSSAGVLSGTPTASGTFPIVVKATDGNGCSGNGATYTLVINACSVVDQTVSASPTNICAGGSSTITVGASQAGVNYTLRTTPSNTVIAGPTASNGPAIAFGTGAIAGTTTYNVLAETDKYSVYLDGSQGGFTIANSASLSLSNNFTIEGWIKPDGGSNYGRLFNKNQSYALGLGSSQTQIVFTAHNQGDYGKAYTFNTGQWYHIACTYVSGTVEFFVNGVSIGTVTGVPTPNSSTQPVRIGSDASGNANQFKGNIDNVRVWSSVRTASEISTNQSAFLTSTGNPTLAGSWWIIEGSGNAKDYSANANNATAFAGTWQADAPVAPCSIVLATQPTVTVAANNTITLTSAAGTNAQTACINQPITNITYSTTGATGATFSGLPTGVTGNWAGNVVTISGTPTTTVGSPFSYTVTLTGGCGTITATGTITVSGTNTITLSSAAGTNAQTVCINAPIVNITYNTTGATGASFTNLPTGVTGNWAANVVTISGTPTTNVGSPFTYSILLTGGCGTVNTTGTITVTAANTIALSSAAGTDNQTVCNNTAITNITYTTTGATGATFSGLPTGVTGNWAANTVTISGTPSVAGPFNYTITLTGGCGTVTTNGTITVNAIPDVTQPANQVVCNTALTAPVTFTGSVAGTTFNWTNNTTSVGLAASGTGNIPAFTATNATGAPVTATVTVTPVYQSANSVTFNYSGAITNWVVPAGVTSVHIVAKGAEGSNNLSALIAPGKGAVMAGDFNVTPGASLKILVGQQVTTTDGNGGGGGTFVTTNTNTPLIVAGGGGGAAQGTDSPDKDGKITTAGGNGAAGGGAGGTGGNGGSIGGSGFQAGAGGGLLTDGANGWTGGSGGQAFVNGGAGAPINAPANGGFGGGASGSSYVVGGGGGGYSGGGSGGNSSAGVGGGGGSYNAGTNQVNTGGANSGNGQVVITYTTGPVCTGTSKTFTYTVNPTATVNTVANQTVCNGANTTAVTFSSPTTGGTIVYNWTNNTPSIGLAGSGTGNIAAFAATNATGAPVTATITVTPSYTNGSATCAGTPTTFTITVNPTATVNAVANQTLCNTQSTTAVTFSSPTTGGTIVYNWTNNTPSIGLAASGSGNIASFVATNTGSSPVTATITVTPAYTNGSVTCNGTPITFTITVNPPPATTCPGNINVNATAGACSAVVNYTASGSGTISYTFTGATTGAGAGTGSGSTFGVGVTTVTVTSTSTCGNSSCTFTVTVNDIEPPVITCPAQIVVCGSQAVTYSLPTVTDNCGGAATPLNLTQTTSTTITANNSISCNNGVGHTNNSYWRVYDLAALGVTGPYTVKKVVFGIEKATSGSGTQPVNIRVYTLSGAFTTANLTQVASESINVADQTGTLLSIALTTPPTVAATAKLVVEVNTPDGRTTSNLLFMGTNSLGQSAPAYISAADCGVTTPTSFTDIGFNNLHLILNTEGTVGGGAIVPVQTAGLPSGATFPVGTTVNTYTATDPSGNTASCSFNVIVNPIPTVNTVTNQTVCNGAPTAAITFTGATAGTVYSWTNNTPSIGLAASGTGNIASFNAVNTGSTPVTATVTVTPSYTNAGLTCTGTPTTFTITVNPTATVNSVASQSLCNGANTAAVTFSSPSTGGTIVYNWTNNTTSIGLAASGSGNIASFVATNATNAPVTATITVTPAYTNGGSTCNGTPITFTITVQPTPSVDAIANQVVCNTANTAAVNFTSPTTGGTVTYAWTNNTTSIGLGASGTGNIPSFVATNAGTAPVTATVTVTPTNSVPGTLVTQTFNYTGSVQNFTVPAGVTSMTITVKGAQGGTVTSNGGPYAGGKGATMKGDFTVVPGSILQLVVGGKGNNDPSSSGGGGGTGVNNGGTALVVAGGGAGVDFQQPNYAGIDASTGTAGIQGSNTGGAGGTAGADGGGTVWTGNNFSYGGRGWNAGNSGSFGQNGVSVGGTTTNGTWGLGGGGGSVGYGYCNCGGGGGGYSGGGSGNINASGGGGGSINTGTNQVNTAGSNTGDGSITISYSPATICTGPSKTFTYTVNPTATVNTVANQVVCNGANTTAVTFSSPTTGGTIVYNWTNNTTSIGLAASGTGNIASFVATNSGTAPVTATITVTPSYTNGGTTCVGTPRTFTITVNPTATVNTVANQVVCNGANTTAVTFSSTATGGTIVYNWTNNTTSIGLAASGTGNIASFVGTNSTALPVTATITVTPSYTNGGTTCVGTPRTFTITVNPTATVNAIPNQVVCNNANTTTVNFTGNIANSGRMCGTAIEGGSITLTAPAGMVFKSVVFASYGTPGGSCGNFTIGSCNATNSVAIVGAAAIGQNTFTIGADNGTFGDPCGGTPKSLAIELSYGPATGTVVYNWTNTNTAIGLAASGSGNSIPSFVATNGTTAPIAGTITVTPVFTNGGINCTGTPTNFTITVNPTATVNTVANQVVCNNANTTAVNFSSPTTGGTIVYNWTNNTTSIGLAASGTGNIASFVATNSGTAPVTATITVTPSYTNGGTTCVGTPITFTITVNPTATVNTVANQVVCNGANTTAVTFSSPTTGGTIVYNWTNNTPSIGLAATGSGNIASFVATNATNAPVTATITVTPSYTNGGVTCVGTPITFTITVNPTATINAVANQTVCNGGSTTAVTFSSPTTGGTIVYNWTNNTTSIGLAANGTGNIPSFVGINATNGPVTATITVTPSYTNGSVTCVGTPITFTITVNPVAKINAVANQVVCNGANTAAITFTSPTTGGTIVYNWLNSTPSIGLAATGSGNIASFVATNASNGPAIATIVVTPSYTNNGVTCTGTPITFTITVNPTATVNTVANQVVCNGANTTAVNFSSPTTGGTIVYNWTNNTTSIGLAASGTGNIASFVATNNGTAPVTATITVTPTYTNGGTTCVGTPSTFTITVNPTATINAVANQTVCNGANTTAVTFTSPTTGGTIVYNWTNSNTAIGLAANGTGNIASFVGTNTTNGLLTGTITVTPSYTNGGTTCVGTPITFTITVNPVATVNTVANQVICNNGNTNAVNFTSPTTGGTITYNWTNSNTAIGLAASGTGNIPSFVATNGTTGPISATITVTPTYSNGGANCVGTPTTFTITVNPTPLVNAVANQTLCNKSITAAVVFSTPNTGGTVVYNWTNSAPSIGLPASGTGNIPSFITNNTSTVPVVATITVTASYTNGGTTCTGPARTFTITVNPAPSITVLNAPSRICLTDTAVVLRATPAGGVWAGTTVTNGIFDPAKSGPGAFTLTYTYTDPAYNCPGIAYANVFVVDCIERHNNFKEAMKVYPNPNNGKFFVKLLSDKYKTINLRMIDARGREVGKFTFSNLFYGSILPFDVRSLAAGVYMLEAYSDYDKATFQVIIQH